MDLVRKMKEGSYDCSQSSGQSLHLILEMEMCLVAKHSFIVILVIEGARGESNYQSHRREPDVTAS